MKAASVPLLALLESGARDIWTARCIEITTKFGVRMRYTDTDVNLQLPETSGAIYRADGARVTIGATTQNLGVETDAIDLTIAPVDSDGAVDPGMSPTPPVPLLIAARNGLLDRAQVVVWRAFGPAPGPQHADLVAASPNATTHMARTMRYTATGALQWFSGQVAELSVVGPVLEISVKSLLDLLNVQFPKYLYRPGCTWDLYGAGCAVPRQNHEHLATIKQGSSRFRIESYQADPDGPQFNSRPAGYFNEGSLQMLTGANTYVRRGVREHPGGGIFVLSQPLPYEAVAGDLFRVAPGCDKTYATCQAKFANQNRFRGFPYLPSQQTVTGSEVRNVTNKVITIPEPVA